MRMAIPLRYAAASLLVMGCSSGSSDEVAIAARLSPSDSLYGAIEVRGLPRSALDDAGPTILRVTAAAPGDTSTEVPQLAGSYIVEGNVLRFEPRYRPSVGLVLRVVVHADSQITREFPLPEAGSAPSSTTVTGVFPSADTIPANHLRWYLEFSAPMREGEAEQHIHLLDDRGQEVDNAFLIVSEELWDPARRRLTVLFDPGRVKRGVRQNLESGAPLVAGRHYRLKVDQAWRDGRSVALREGFEKRFYVTDAERRGMNPGDWKLEPPRVGTREPVTIDFGRALDRALAERLVVVMDGGEMVAGRVQLAQGERRWQLVPETGWPDRELEVRVSPILEDPAGNRIGQTFDRDRARGEWREGEAGQPVTIRFRPLLYSSARAR